MPRNFFYTFLLSVILVLFHFMKYMYSQPLMHTSLCLPKTIILKHLICTSNHYKIILSKGVGKRPMWAMVSTSGSHYQIFTSAMGDEALANDDGIDVRRPHNGQFYLKFQQNHLFRSKNNE